VYGAASDCREERFAHLGGARAHVAFHRGRIDGSAATGRGADFAGERHGREAQQIDVFDEKADQLGIERVRALGGRLQRPLRAMPGMQPGYDAADLHLPDCRACQRLPGTPSAVNDRARSA
jgi:hypothetical protein